MSIITIKSNEAKIGFSFDRRQEFLLDSVDDFYNLPFDCAPGSKAYLADNSRCWMMGGELEWVECVIVTGDSGIVPADVLRYTHQVLNSDQKSQARNNIGAANTEDIAQLYEEIVENDLPTVYFGNSLARDKSDRITTLRFVSKAKDIKCYCTTKAQGNSSMTFPKKNQTVKVYSDAACEDKLKIGFRNWGMQNKFCIKANWNDLSHMRNVISARIWGDVVRARHDFESMPELMRTSPNFGAVDGFPVRVFADGVYQGRYAFNIPKDKWMANMDDDNPNHCILCGEAYGSGCFRAPAKIDGSDWSDELHEIVPENIKTRWNECISFVMNSTDEEFVTELANYFNVPSLIDYHIFGLVSCHMDGFGKNQIFLTYDGNVWYASVYDMDATWGNHYMGTTLVDANYPRTSYEDYVSTGSTGDGNLLYVRLEALFADAIKARWEELKISALSVDNILNHFEKWAMICPPWLIEEDYAETTANGAFVDMPGKTTNNIQQIRAFAKARHEYVNKLLMGNSENLWSISDKTLATTPTYIEPKMVFDFSPDKYYKGIARGGYVNLNNPQNASLTIELDGEDVIISNTQACHGYGLAVPIELVPGEMYRLAFETTSIADVSIMYYNADKVYQTTNRYIDGTLDAPGAYEFTFIAQDYPYALLHTVPTTTSATADLPVTLQVKNIVIEKV